MSDISNLVPKLTSSSHCDNPGLYPWKLNGSFSISDSGSVTDQVSDINPPPPASVWNYQQQIWIHSSPTTLQLPITPSDTYPNIESSTYYSDEPPDHVGECETVANSSWSTTPGQCSPSTKFLPTPPIKSPQCESNNRMSLSPTTGHQKSLYKSLGKQSSQDYTPTSTASRQLVKEPLPATTRSHPNRRAIKPKESHKAIEKKYRNRLNGYFGRLFAAVTKRPHVEEVSEKMLDRRVSKGKVLVLAIEHIRVLEMQCESLEKERKRLLDDIEKMRYGWGEKVNYGAFRW